MLQPSDSRDDDAANRRIGKAVKPSTEFREWPDFEHFVNVIERLHNVNSLSSRPPAAQASSAIGHLTIRHMTRVARHKPPDFIGVEQHGWTNPAARAPKAVA